MTPQELVERLLAVPYRPGMADFDGCDCWGLVEIWYRELLGIELTDRSDHPTGPHGLALGFTERSGWMRQLKPHNHAVAILRAGGLDAGHCGIYWKGSILHTDERAGCVYEPVASRMIRHRINCYLIRADHE